MSLSACLYETWQSVGLDDEVARLVGQCKYANCASSELSHASGSYIGEQL